MSPDDERPVSEKARAIERAANDVLRGDECEEPCPECGAILDVKVIRPDVLVRCPNGHIDAHRTLESDPGWGMRAGFFIAAGIIIILGLLRRFYFAGLPDPHPIRYEDVPPPPPAAMAPAQPGTRAETPASPSTP